MKRYAKKLLAVLPLAAVCALSAACGSEECYSSEKIRLAAGYAAGNYEFNAIVENGFTDVSSASSSYFSLDCNTATYSLVRAQLNGGLTVAPSSVRIEEMINYFGYSFPAPDGDAVSVTGYLGDCPWNGGNKLLLAGIKTAELSLGDARANYVFLIDVSGSMQDENRLSLAKEALSYFVDGLKESDYISIVTYAGEVSTVLNGAACSDENKAGVKQAINSLTAYGETNGSGGLERAYGIARDNFIEGGNNRVILISDGDFNAGYTDTDALETLIGGYAESGVHLSVLGVGMGNLRDDILETLALKGNGNYAYLDSLTEAKRVLSEELGGTLVTVAENAKAKVTFTDNVARYRLIGYDTKIISSAQFESGATDAGELGSNLCVAALYEIELADGADGDLAQITVNYSDVRSGEKTVRNAYCDISVQTTPSDDLTFISCVAEFGLILRRSAYRGTASLSSVLSRLESLGSYVSDDAYKSEFTELVQTAKNAGYDSQS